MKEVVRLGHALVDIQLFTVVPCGAGAEWASS